MTAKTVPQITKPDIMIESCPLCNGLEIFSGGTSNKIFPGVICKGKIEWIVLQISGLLLLLLVAQGIDNQRRGEKGSADDFCLCRDDLELLLRSDAVFLFAVVTIKKNLSLLGKFVFHLRVRRHSSLFSRETVLMQIILCAMIRCFASPKGDLVEESFSADCNVKCNTGRVRKRRVDISCRVSLDRCIEAVSIVVGHIELKYSSC